MNHFFVCGPEQLEGRFISFIKSNTTKGTPYKKQTQFFLYSTRTIEQKTSLFIMVKCIFFTRFGDQTGNK